MKRIRILLAVLCLAAVLTGCAGKDTTGRAEPVSAAAESSQPAPEAEEPAESELSDRIPMVMVNGALYYDTGEESTLDGRCGTYDGEITTAVEGTEIPSEDGQSNFGTGYPYQYTGEGQIDLLIDGKWMIFEQRDGRCRRAVGGDAPVARLVQQPPRRRTAEGERHPARPAGRNRHCGHRRRRCRRLVITNKTRAP